MAPKAEPLTLATTPSGPVSTYAPPTGPLEPVRESPARSIKRVLTTDLALQEEEMKQSRKAIKEATRVLEYSDSTFKDQFTAVCILIFVTLEHHRSSRLAWWISILLFLAILLNAVCLVTGSIRSTMIQPRDCPVPVCVPGEGPCTTVVCEPEENPILMSIEMWTIVVFTVDYLLRIMTVPFVPTDLAFHRSLEYTMDGRLKDRSKGMGGCKKLTKYMTSPLNVIDLISIVPFYVLLLLRNTRFYDSIDILRMFRFLRFLLIFKLGRRFRLGGAIIGRTLRASVPALVIFFFLTVMAAVTFGSIMYFFEGGMYQVTQEFPGGGFLRPNARNTGMEMSPFTSIFTGIYWFVVNTTTLGNAALFPTTTGGRIFSCVVAYVGLATLALPISIIGKNFSEQYDLVYTTMPDAAKSLGVGGATPMAGKGGRVRAGMTPSMKALTQMVGADGKAFFNVGGSSAAEQEVEALRAHFQAQIDGLRAQLEAANATSEKSWDGAGPMQEELEGLRAFVEKELAQLKQGLVGGAGGQGQRQQQVGFTPPLSDDDTAGGDDHSYTTQQRGARGQQRGPAGGLARGASVGSVAGGPPPPIVLGSYSAAVTRALAQAAQNDPDDDDDDEYFGEEERQYHEAREALRQQELYRFRSQMVERGRRMSGSVSSATQQEGRGGGPM